MIQIAKRWLEAVPEPLAWAFVRVPFSWRLGRAYENAKRDIARYEALTDEQKRECTLRKVRAIVNLAVRENAFYRWYYREAGFSPETLRVFDDIARVPVVTKQLLRQWPLDKRTTGGSGQFRVNTGGTSGEALEFYLDRQAFAREWAHMHHAWLKLGYDQTDLKLTFRGKYLGGRAVKYNPVHNEYIVSAYRPLNEVASAVLALTRNRNIAFLHGYPSRVAEFARFCIEQSPQLRRALSKSLRGILLGSEYPAPPFRRLIDEAFGVPTLSWYGHSEMAVFAFERTTPYVYVPMQTYGFAEAVGAGDGTFHLVGTSYTNTATPFIRYDTSDLIRPTVSAGLLTSFEVAEGRVGEFVTDRRGSRISLTALIFGRHHSAFGLADCVQVRQDHPGHIVVLVTPTRYANLKGVDWSSMFDFAEVDLDVSFEVSLDPIRTAAGKTPLLLPTSP